MKTDDILNLFRLYFFSQNYKQTNLSALLCQDWSVFVFRDGQNHTKVILQYAIVASLQVETIGG